MIGERHNWDLKTLVGSESPVSLHPTWDYLERNNKNKSFVRTQGGQLNAFTKVGNYNEYSLPVDYVTSASATLINSWWSSDSELELTVSRGIGGQQFGINVKITNDLNPLNMYVENKYTAFKGLVFLTTYDNSGATFSPLILDDPIFGTLDFNRLG